MRLHFRSVMSMSRCSLIERRTSVIDIIDGRKKETLQRWLKDNQESLKELDSVTMDM